MIIATLVHEGVFVEETVEVTTEVTVSVAIEFVAVVDGVVEDV